MNTLSQVRPCVLESSLAQQFLLKSLAAFRSDNIRLIKNHLGWVEYLLKPFIYTISMTGSWHGVVRD